MSIWSVYMQFSATYTIIGTNALTNAVIHNKLILLSFELDIQVLVFRTL